MYRILTCDADKNRRAELSEMLRVFANEREREIEIGEFDNPEELLKSLEKKADIIFWNIRQVGEAYFLEHKKKLRKNADGALFFLVGGGTPYFYSKDIIGEYVCIRLPLEYARLRESLEGAIKKIDLRHSDRRSLYARMDVNGSMDYVEISRICYVEIKRGRTIVHTLDRQYVSFIRNPEINVLAVRYPENFVKVRGGIVINIRRLSHISFHESFALRSRSSWPGYFAVLENHANIRICARDYDMFRSYLVQQIREEINASV